MAELLIKATDNVNPKIEDHRLWKRGDIVAVVDDGHEWGMRESFDEWVKHGNRPEDWSGNFIIVKVRGKTKAQLQNFKRDKRDAHGNIQGRSQYRIDLDGVDAEMRQRAIRRNDAKRELPFEALQKHIWQP